MALLLVACGGAGLSRADVVEIVRAELADAPAPEPGLTSADAEDADEEPDTVAPAVLARPAYPLSH